MTTFAELQARLSCAPDHDRFIGEPIDIGKLTPDELGRLWPLLQRVRCDLDAAAPLRQQADEVLRQAQQKELAPRLDNRTLLATLRAVPQAPTPVAALLSWAACLATDPDPALDAALAPLLPKEEQWTDERHALLAIGRALGARRMVARLADAVVRHFGDSLPAREFTVLRETRLAALLALARSGHLEVPGVDSDRPADAAAALADDPDYLVFAQAALEEAARRLERIHAGELPYQAGGACNRDEAAVLGLAARVAATRDAPWYPDLIARLLPGACVAPTAARTAPSQALTIALGHAIEAVPTPEAVMALRQALSVVRHAGLQKKLERHRKPAERGLLRRPQVALRLLDAGLEAKQQRALLTQFFEAALVQGFTLPYEEWRRRLLANEATATFARTLVWHAGVAFMLDDGDAPADAQGQPLVIAAEAQVSLWHPVEADDGERDAWRARILQRKLRQPVRQAFREFYQPSDADLFAGYELSVVRLIGLARREGWVLESGCLERSFGDVRLCFVLSQDIYPGLDGVVASRALRFARGRQALALHELAPRLLSEACRAVDLLASVSAVALETDEDDTPGRSRRVLLLAGQAGIDAIRRQVLAQVLQPQVAAGSVRIDGFYVHAGEARVSIRTGRVLRAGAPVELDLGKPGKRLRALPWVPYDEALLERVLHSVGALLAPQ
jgi:hypothetical protein